MLTSKVIVRLQFTYSNKPAVRITECYTPSSEPFIIYWHLLLIAYVCQYNCDPHI
jgi:hypothetical protein